MKKKNANNSSLESFFDILFMYQLFDTRNIKKRLRKYRFGFQNRIAAINDEYLRKEDYSYDLYVHKVPKDYKNTKMFVEKYSRYNKPSKLDLILVYLPFLFYIKSIISAVIKAFNKHSFSQIIFEVCYQIAAISIIYGVVIYLVYKFVDYMRFKLGLRHRYYYDDC